MTEMYVDSGASTEGKEPAPGLASLSSRGVVLTGFEPFHGRTRNRSWELVRRLELPEDRERHCLPVDFARVREMVLGILETRPRALLMVGEAPTAEVLVEQIALNAADVDEPDNAGRMPQNQLLVEGAPLAYRASWDARLVAGRMHQEGIPAVVSFHAGTFACNAALYFALHSLAQRDSGDGPDPSPGTAVGFLHVPNTRGVAGLRMANLARAVELAASHLTEDDGG